MPKFKSYSQGQLQFFPMRLDERIKENDPVRLVNSIVDSLDISDLLASYKSQGASSYSPRMLLKVIFYAYMNNVYSCRKIEKSLNENIHYMWLSGGQYPSFNTINRFRSEHLKDYINYLFSQVVLMIAGLGYVSLDVSYIDGTKIESVANKYTFVWRKTTEKNKAKLEAKIHSILNQIEEGIAQDNASLNDEELPAIDSKTLKDKIDELNKQNLDKKKDKTKIKKIKELEKHQSKLAEYENKLDILGDRNSYSKTDPDATFMRMKEDAMNNGQTKPGYNLQIGTNNQFITNFALYPNAGDTTTLKSFLTLQQARLGIMPKAVCADSGYGSEENYKFLEDNDIEAFVKFNYFHKEQTKSYKNNPFLQDNLFYNSDKDYFVCPMGQHMKPAYDRDIRTRTGFKTVLRIYRASNCKGCLLRGSCYKAHGDQRQIEVNLRLRNFKINVRELLNSEAGREHRRKRAIEPEAVFGQMKFNKFYKRFRHKGFEKVQMDFGVFAIAFNLLKLYRKMDLDEKLHLILFLCFIWAKFQKISNSKIKIYGNFDFLAEKKISA